MNQTWGGADANARRDRDDGAACRGLEGVGEREERLDAETQRGRGSVGRAAPIQVVVARAAMPWACIIALK